MDRSVIGKALLKGLNPMGSVLGGSMAGPGSVTSTIINIVRAHHRDLELMFEWSQDFGTFEWSQDFGTMTTKVYVYIKGYSSFGEDYHATTDPMVMASNLIDRISKIVGYQEDTEAVETVPEEPLIDDGSKGWTIA